MQVFFEFFDGLKGLSADTLNLVAGGVIAWGALNCFFGYRLFKVVLGILGAAGGAWLGASVGAAASDGQQLWIIVGSVIGGLVVGSPLADS